MKKAERIEERYFVEEINGASRTNCSFPPAPTLILSFWPREIRQSCLVSLCSRWFLSFAPLPFRPLFRQPRISSLSFSLVCTTELLRETKERTRLRVPRRERNCSTSNSVNNPPTAPPPSFRHARLALLLQSEMVLPWTLP